MTTKLNKFHRPAAAFAALAACLIAGSAFAATPDAPSVKVGYGDLDLTSEQGLNTLHARVTAAARQVCAPDGLDIRNLQAYAAARSCETQAIASAVDGVQSAKVAASVARR